MEPEGEGEDLTPPYQSSESTVCETETARWGDMDEDVDMDFGYTKKPPSSASTRRPAGDPPRPPGGGLSGPPGGRPPGGPPGGGSPGRGGPPGPGGPSGGPPGGPPGDPNGPPEDGDPEGHLAVDRPPPQEGPGPRARGRHGQVGMQIRSEFNWNSPNLLRILSQREFPANSA